MTTQGPSVKDVLLESISLSLGEQAVETLPLHEAQKDGKADHEKLTTVSSAPICITQTPVPANYKHGPADILVGLNAECPRWVPGSIVCWTAFSSGYKSTGDAEYAAKQLSKAAEEWNKAKVGVQFKYVDLPKDASFILCYGGAQGTVLASAFFPNSNDLNNLMVYDAAFNPQVKPGMWQVFLHELGHVIGLRHEFALEKEQNLAAESLGPRNELSVMNYRKELPQLQASDIESTKLFYSMKDDSNGKHPRVGLTEVVDYTPR